MSLANVKRGDEVFVVTYGSRRNDGVQSAEYRTVVSSGPKYVTAGEGYKQGKFHRDSGTEATDYNARRFAYVSEGAWRIKQDRDALMARAGRLARDLQARRLTDEQLHTLIALLEPHA